MENAKVETKKDTPVSRQDAGYVERRAAEDAAQVKHHEGVRVCAGCGQEKRVQAYCNRCACMTCTSCCRKCPEKANRND